MSVTPSNTYKLTAVHPAYAAHQHLDRWDSNGLFPKINQILEKEGKTKIRW